jgi:hypothetical protein
VYDTWGNATGRSVSYADARRYHYTFVFMNDVVFGASATKFNLAGKKKLGLQPMGDGNFRRTPAGSTPNRRSVQRPHSMVTAWGVFVGAIFAFVLYVVLQGFGVASLLVNLLPAHHSTINFFGTMILEVVVFAFGDHLGNKHAHRRHIRRQVSSDIER